MARNWNWWSRKLHRWGALVTVVPMLLVIATGILLQVKKEVEWIQPSTVKGSVTNATPEQSFEAILNSARTVTEAEIEDWDDIDRLDVRLDKGIVKVQAQNHWEIQIDLADGAILSSTYRRSDIIESLHDGSFFADAAKLWIFLPNGLILLGLWLSGIWLWYIPLGAKRKKAARKRAAAS